MGGDLYVAVIYLAACHRSDYNGMLSDMIYVCICPPYMRMCIYTHDDMQFLELQAPLSRIC